jgi:hypothetical protein
VTAADYLNRSVAFERDFDVVRAAVSRPYARMDGDYAQPFAMPIPNFITMRIVAQTLADRTKCHLLLGEPDKALRDLTLIQDLCRLLEAKPTGKPMTLVAAMVNVAVMGLYTSIIADGMRLQAWREPQLAAIQQQLEEVNLPSFVAEALRDERAAVTHSLEKTPLSEIADQFITIGGDKPNLWRRLKNPMYSFIKFAPRGWVYQNMITHVAMLQPVVDGYDPTKNEVFPTGIKNYGDRIHSLSKWSPYTFLESTYLPNFVNAWRTLARNQTQANQALLACALERYRLAHDQYPESLDALVPQFIEKIPRDLIGGQPLHYRHTDAGKFLLYSIGWNEKDDGGEVALNKEGKEDLENGDWVWSAK